MSSHRKTTRGVLIGATALAGALAMMASPAAAQERSYSFEIPPQSLDTALRQYSRTTNQQLIFADPDVRGLKAPALNGAYSADEALQVLLAGTDLTVTRTARGVVQIATDSNPQGGSAEDVSAVEELIVTAQKREENIQDVPIAISAFSQKSLEEQKIEGGFDLLKAIPNVTFSKNNFTGYNFSIRGVGTKAVSATTDPGVAVAFNNTTLIHNRLFEQEYLDMERVEVLRGPQGTLYGRNATSGVINIISAKPDLGVFEGTIKGEVGNYNTKRLSAMMNIPIIEDVLAVRLAGSLTSRDGFDYNDTTKNAINGRDLWTARVSVGFEPTERIRGNLIWERFNEDDDRSRTGKQLCHRDAGPTHVGGVNLADGATRYTNLDIRRALFAQGCKPGSLYDDAAFGTPNGLSYNFILGAVALKDSGSGIGSDPTKPQSAGLETVIQPIDPYGGLMQSYNLREINSIRDPRYRAAADLIQLNFDFDITPELTFVSQTAYNEDKTYSFQDYNRFKSLPVFTDTSNLRQPVFPDRPSQRAAMAPGGVFCDPQIGCSNTVAGFDISQAESEQFSQEFRLQSSFDGPLNFSAGVNYTQFETVIDYYVMFNLLTALSWTSGFHPMEGSSPEPWNPAICPGSNTLNGGGGGNYLPVPASDPQAMCVYVDPNPVESINGEGHNYFRSKNPYRLKSTAAFGEAYWKIRDDLKLTAGLRYTDDRKTFIPVPSQTLLARSLFAGGSVSAGYPEDPPIKQKWGEFTGRLGLDWQPELAFTDETMLYAFYSRGYKGGGANPPSPDFATEEEFLANAAADGVDLSFYILLGTIPPLTLTAVEYGPTFDPEFVDAFEIGAKNTLLGGALKLNVTGFYYDYKDYQVSQIRDRTAVNENFDAKTWGFEVEALFAPTRNLRINANLGYLDTEIADGETSIDIMDRTQSNPDYTLVKPWVALPSNCVVPTQVAAQWARTHDGLIQYYNLCGGLKGLVTAFSGTFIADPAYGGAQYDYNNYPELNGGAGLRADLGGNELPNAPHWTANIGAQYRMELSGDWTATVRGDVYWQSQSWARVYNSDPYDKLHGWFNTNLSVWIEKPEDDLKIELYVKNLLGDSPITDAFLNSDDTGLTTNVFTLDPRVIGLSIRKGF